MQGKKMQIRLSKSKIMSGLQCPKKLYFEIHHPELTPPVSEAQQAIFDIGHQVGAEAQKRFPGGILIKAPYTNIDAAVAETAEAIKKGAKTIFEATFKHDDTLVKVDILNRKTKNSDWQLIEVKSSTKPKDEHLDDIAIQTHVLTKAGIALTESSLMHLNSACRYPQVDNLFTKKNLSEEIEPKLADLPGLLRGLRDQLMKPKSPEVDIGPHCDTPYECPYKAQCWKHIPEHSVFDLPRIGKKAFELYEKGIVSLKDKKLPEFKGTKARIVDVVRKGKRWVDAEGIAAMMKDWEYPLYYLDFETIGHAIPKFEGTKPYENVPFQFSCHIECSPGSKLEHLEFLYEGNTDPRRACADALLKAIGPKGSIVAYHSSFERGVIKKLAEQFPKDAKRLLALADRLVDPEPIISECVYDAGFKGSFSIKVVAPMILGPEMSYDDLAIGDGGAAQRAFVQMTSEECEPKMRASLKRQLMQYCTQDTRAMVELVRWLRRQ